MNTNNGKITRIECRIVPVKKWENAWTTPENLPYLENSDMENPLRSNSPTFLEFAEGKRAWKATLIAPEALPKLRSWKARVMPDESKAIQERYISLGGSWHSGDKRVKFTHSKRLYSEAGKISRFNDNEKESHFIAYPLPEVDPQAILDAPDEYWFDYGPDLTLPLTEPKQEKPEPVSAWAAGYDPNRGDMAAEIEQEIAELEKIEETIISCSPALHDLLNERLKTTHMIQSGLLPSLNPIEHYQDLQTTVTLLEDFKKSHIAIWKIIKEKRARLNSITPN